MRQVQKIENTKGTIQLIQQRQIIDKQSQTTTCHYLPV